MLVINSIRYVVQVVMNCETISSWFFELRTITRARLVSSASANWVSVAVFMYSPYQSLRMANKSAQGSPGSPHTEPCFHLPSEGMRCVPSAVQVSHSSAGPRLCGSSQSMRSSVSSQKRTMNSDGQTRNESRDRSVAKEKRMIDVLVIWLLFIHSP